MGPGHALPPWVTRDSLALYGASYRSVNCGRRQASMVGLLAADPRPRKASMVRLLAAGPRPRKASVVPCCLTARVGRRNCKRRMHQSAHAYDGTEIRRRLNLTEHEFDGTRLRRTVTFSLSDLGEAWGEGDLSHFRLPHRWQNTAQRGGSTAKAESPPQLEIANQANGSPRYGSFSNGRRRTAIAAHG